MTTERPRVPGRVFVTWQTSLYDGCDHAITDEEFAFGPRRRQGEFEAVCGAVFCLAGSHSPPGRRCACCVAFLRAHTSPPPPQDGIPRRPGPGWMGRLIGHTA